MHSKQIGATNQNTLLSISGILAESLDLIQIDIFSEYSIQKGEVKPTSKLISLFLNKMPISYIRKYIQSISNGNSGKAIIRQFVDNCISQSKRENIKNIDKEIINVNK